MIIKKEDEGSLMCRQQSTTLDCIRLETQIANHRKKFDIFNEGTHAFQFVGSTCRAKIRSRQRRRDENQRRQIKRKKGASVLNWS